MKEIYNKLKELYEINPNLFGILLFIDLAIIYLLIKYLF